jgi:DNA helicase-2/ATP-dependent DNA helicase PcrA
VTFTNKAAREMKERVGAMVGDGAGHAVARHVPLDRREDPAPSCGARRAQSNFTILDTDDQIRLIKQMLKPEGIDEKRWPARQLAGYHRRLEEPRADARSGAAGEAFSFADGGGVKLYAIYQARLKVLNACDFGDLC